MKTRSFARLGSVALLGAGALLFGGAAALGAGRPASDALEGADGVAQAECGKPGQAPCPLQGWMRANVAAPLAANDGEALASGLERSAKLAPDPAWSSWVTSAKAGAAAAKKGDIAGARASCKSCHDAWKEAYKAKYRARPVPR
jgi:hypothetical protein